MFGSHTKHVWGSEQCLVVTQVSEQCLVVTQGMSGPVSSVCSYVRHVWASEQCLVVTRGMSGPVSSVW